jgi:ABC-type microcin C transport system permease subunit YejE
MFTGALATNYWRAKDMTVEKKIDSWSSPPQGFLMINIDAVYDPDLGKGAI